MSNTGALCFFVVLSSKVVAFEKLNRGGYIETLSLTMTLSVPNN